MDTFAADLVGTIRSLFETARDAERAAPMAAYMRHQFAFLGIPKPTREALTRTALAGTRAPTADGVATVALACWDLPEREYQYFAADYTVRHARRLPSRFVPTVRTLITTKSWWDTVDVLASRVVGPLVRRDPTLGKEMDRWIEHENLWLARSAIIHQLGAKAATDTDRLFDYSLQRAADTDFFIRKAIGWALREYSKTDPDAVRAFVARHAAVLSPLSRREALKWLGRPKTP